MHPMRRWSALLLAVLMPLIYATGRATDNPIPANAAAAYQEGVVAFQAGDYGHARAAFLRARQAGYTGPELAYSLGAACYRLGLYDEAGQEFNRLLDNPRLAALAHYNLGLLAVKQGDEAAAAREFQAAYAQASEPALRRLAAEAMARHPPPPPESSGFGYAMVSAGYDDDVAPLPQSNLVAPSQQGSPLLSLLAGGTRILSGSYSDGLQLNGSLYHADYPRLSQYNETVLRLGPEYDLSSGPWTSNLGVSGEHITLGGATLQDSLVASMGESWKAAADNTLKGVYEYEHVQGGNNFGYLSGWRQALRIEDRRSGDDYLFTAGYEHEINGREDLTTTLNGSITTLEFFSASPTRDRVYTQFRLDWTQKLSLRLAASYERSHYDRPDVIVTAGTSTETVVRDDGLSVASVGLAYAWSREWHLEAEYRYLDNASNLPLYAYRSRRVTLSLEYLFL